MADRQLKIDITVDDHGAAKTAKAVEASLKSAGAAATGQAQSFDRLSSSVGSTNGEPQRSWDCRSLAGRWPYSVETQIVVMASSTGPGGCRGC